MKSIDGFAKLLHVGVQMTMDRDSEDWYITTDHDDGKGRVIYPQEKVLEVVSAMGKEPYKNNLLEGFYDVLLASTVYPLDDSIRLVADGLTGRELVHAFENGIDVALLTSLRSGLV